MEIGRWERGEGRGRDPYTDTLGTVLLLVSRDDESSNY